MPSGRQPPFAIVKGCRNLQSKPKSFGGWAKLQQTVLHRQYARCTAYASVCTENKLLLTDQAQPLSKASLSRYPVLTFVCTALASCFAEKSEYLANS